ncbi:hypothetical protein C0993_009619, partial [Termitomyces sp. T159_Od127]
MSHCDDHASSSQHYVNAQHESSATENVVTTTQTQTEVCQNLVDEAVDGKLAFDECTNRLHATGISVVAAQDYFNEVRERIAIRFSKSKRPVTALTLREVTPEGPAEDELAGLRKDRSTTLSDEDQIRQCQAAAEESAWAALQAKLDMDYEPTQTQPLLSLVCLAELLQESNTPINESSSIPQSVFTAVPHLAQLSSRTLSDSHIARTWQLRQEYAKERVIDPLVNLGQSQLLRDPISRAMWRLVILDHYVDFEKLYATLDRGYDQHDDPKDFGGGFSLVRKDQANAKRPICSEADWTRVFDAWKAAVVIFYPHRSSELEVYREQILDFFHSLPGFSTIAIQFDCDTRDRYARNPFHMDDQKELHIPFLAQMLNTVSTAGTSVSKRNLPYNPQARKRATTICQNWNLVGIIEPEIMKNVSLSSGLEGNNTKPPQESLDRIKETLSSRTIPLKSEKRKADTSLLESQRFRRGFVWEPDILSLSFTSPSALDTLMAAPLPSPPIKLIEDPVIHQTLAGMKDHIRVETPFHVDRFEALLWDHPNQPFVRSVMRSLREGFWPFDEGEWDDLIDDSLQNYASEDIDIEAIRSFRDREIEKGRWSGPLDNNELLPGMKASPLFVVWQK